ncbi:MAG: hypothetical protein RIC55_16970 [Pirellulaceae bacterium]
MNSLRVLLKRSPLPWGHVGPHAPEGESGDRATGGAARARATRMVALHLLLLLVTCAVVLPLNRDLLFMGFDGSYFKNQIRQQTTWMPRRLGFGGTPFQGVGNVFFLNNFRFQPAAGLSGLLNGGRVSPTTIYTIVSCEMFLAVLLLARSFRAGMFPSLLAAWLATLAIMPFVYPPPIYYAITWLAPTAIEFIALNCLVLALFGWIGKGSVANSLWLGAAVISILLLMLCTIPVAYVLIAPTLLVVGAAHLLSTQTARERWTKIGLLAAMGISAAPTALPFLGGVFLYTVPGMLGGELFNDRIRLGSVSILFHSSEGWLGVWLVPFSTACSLRLLFSCRRSHRALAAATLLLTALVVGGGMLLTFVFTQYDGPTMLYFEFAVWPLYFITAALGAAPLLALFGRFLLPLTRCFTELLPRTAASAFGRRLGFRETGFRAPYALRGAAVLSLLPLAAIACSLPDGAQLPEYMIWHFPPRRNAIVDRLEQQIALRPGRPFRGSVATFTGYHQSPPGVNWLDQHSFDSRLQAKIGNELRAVGLWHYDIPTLFEYNQLMSPTFFVMATRKLARPGDRQIRNVIVLSKVDADYLTSIGVRYAIADNDEPLGQGAKLCETIESADGPPIRLFEFDRPNVGDYSPTEVLVAGDVSEALSLLDDQFDYRRSVVLHAPLSTPLVPADDSAVTIERHGMRVRASSRGTSLLLLPLQFSHCLDVRPLRGDLADVQLVRANVMQAALVFSGEIDLRIGFQYGPFANPYGRLADYREAKQLDLAATPPATEPSATNTDTLYLPEAPPHRKTTADLDADALIQSAHKDSPAAASDGLKR